jgi:hypothetical protein
MVARTGIKPRNQSNPACGASSAKIICEGAAPDIETKLKNVVAAIAISESYSCRSRDQIGGQ